MLAHDWRQSPIGPPTSWPVSLRTVGSLMLDSKFPMFLAWGAELTFLYNNAYAEILGDKHPTALGRRFQDIWSKIWGDIHPIVERAMGGAASFYENLPLTMRRKGYTDQTWFTFSYSPVYHEDGKVGGVYCACTETTQQVLAERHRQEENARLRMSGPDLAMHALQACPALWVILTSGSEAALDAVTGFRHEALLKPFTLSQLQVVLQSVQEQTS